MDRDMTGRRYRAPIAICFLSGFDVSRGNNVRKPGFVGAFNPFFETDRTARSGAGLDGTDMDLVLYCESDVVTEIVPKETRRRSNGRKPSTVKLNSTSGSVGIFSDTSSQGSQCEEHGTRGCRGASYHCLSPITFPRPGGGPRSAQLPVRAGVTSNRILRCRTLELGT
jgi:hypothetical protein